MQAALPKLSWDMHSHLLVLNWNENVLRTIWMNSCS